MDPHASNVSLTTAFVSNVYETLARFDDKLQIEPALAESWQTVSPTVWRFRLRREVRFHNGDPFSADVGFADGHRSQAGPGQRAAAVARDVELTPPARSARIPCSRRTAFRRGP